MAYAPGIQALLAKPRDWECIESNVPECALALAVSFIIFTIIYRIYFHPLRDVPGPLAAKVTELWRTGKYARGNWHQDILDLHSKYGPVVRVSPNEVSFVDKHALAQVYGHGKGTRKFFNSMDPAEHSFLRKRVSGAFTMSTILSLESEIQGNADLLWSKLDQFAQQGKSVNLHHWSSYFAFDVVGKIGIGAPIGFLENGGDIKDIIKSIHNGFYHLSNLGYIPGQQAWVNNPVTQFMFKLLRGKGSSFSTFNEWSLKQVVDRLNEPKDVDRKRDILDYFIEMKEPNGDKATLPSVLIEIGNLIGAGADTTAIGICSVLAELIPRPKDLLRIRQEVDMVHNEIANGKDDHIGIPYVMLAKLPFLNACIKEALRLHPSILWQLPREAPASGIEIAGHFIPPSATLSMSPVAHNRDKTIFGLDADEWKPERWITGKINSESNIREMDKYNTTFGYGARVCIGRNLALVEIHKIIAEFCRRYDAEFVNKEQPFTMKSQWFSYHGEMNVLLKPREMAV
ncbi:unnamed protein product [Clonostachys rosea]|uniref:Cytochrome P450 n=1 Tax=Bionectria ochroleuca TaxID=29856 RepID=A0ABY6V207_BIOOC|nr:unnamed protein product [Clonostachys rosea]